MNNDIFVFQRCTAMLPVESRTPYWENQGPHCDSNYLSKHYISATYVLFGTTINGSNDYVGKS